MSKQILFVDDDPSLLRTMKRNLSLDHEVETAEGAEMAMELIETHGAFSVVFVDMQMPQFNGIETIRMLREKMPDAVFSMLTGNQDQATAMKAVNDGNVFRFLNKPCELSEIRQVIEAAQAQYNQSHSDKELLSGTFSGAISIMADLIELPDDRQIDTSRMANAISELAGEMGVPIDWEEEIAARVFLVGLSMLSADESRRFQTLDPTTEEHQELFRKVCRTSASVVRKMPRLGWVVELLKVVPDAEVFNASNDRKEVAAVLLRAVFYWNFLTLKGHSPESATSIIEQVMPRAGGKLVAAVHSLHDNHDAHVLRHVSVGDLTEGMIPHTDLRRESGEQIGRAGRQLTLAMIGNLTRLPEFQGARIPVIENSIVAV